MRFKIRKLFRDVCEERTGVFKAVVFAILVGSDTFSIFSETLCCK
jgi:hypothetical protein